MDPGRAIPGTGATRTTLRPGGFPRPRPAAGRFPRVRPLERTRPCDLEGSAGGRRASLIGGCAGEPGGLARRASTELEVRRLQTAKRCGASPAVRMAGEPGMEVVGQARCRVPGARIEPGVEFRELLPQPGQPYRRIG